MVVIGSSRRKRSFGGINRNGRNVTTNAILLLLGGLISLLYGSPALVVIELPSSESKSSSNAALFAVDGFRTTTVPRRWQLYSRSTSVKGSKLRGSLASPLQLALSSSIVTDALSTYNSCLIDHYYPTQCLTNAVVTVIGDGVAQKKQHQKRGYDSRRGAVYFCKGLGSGVLWSWWFQQADGVSHSITTDLLRSSTEDSTVAMQQLLLAWFHLQQKQTETIVQTSVNIMLEQFLVCPILFTTWDIPVTSVLLSSMEQREDSNIERNAPNVPHEIRSKLGPLLVANAKVWTLANIVTYNIPYQYRILFTSAASVLSESINAGITSSSSLSSSMMTPTKQYDNDNEESVITMSEIPSTL